LLSFEFNLFLIVYQYYYDCDLNICDYSYVNYEVSINITTIITIDFELLL